MPCGHTSAWPRPFGRVASRVPHRDAAHINNPLGGMGMNGGIDDAVNLAGRLAAVWRGDAHDAELDRFDKQRRLVTLEYIQKYTIQNKKNLESSGEAFESICFAFQ
jgi:3-(3-hydroxy-phenyl)propionate hydroxylase